MFISSSNTSSLHLNHLLLAQQDPLSHQNPKKPLKMSTNTHNSTSALFEGPQRLPHKTHLKRTYRLSFTYSQHNSEYCPTQRTREITSCKHKQQATRLWPILEEIASSLLVSTGFVFLLNAIFVFLKNASTGGCPDHDTLITLWAWWLTVRNWSIVVLWLGKIIVNHWNSVVSLAGLAFWLGKVLLHLFLAFRRLLEDGIFWLEEAILDQYRSRFSNASVSQTGYQGHFARG